MKNVFLCAIAFFAVSAVYALELGSVVSDIPPTVWVSPKGVSLNKEAADSKAVMLVLAGMNSPQTISLLPFMNETVEDYGDAITFALLFDDDREDICSWQLFNAMPDCAVGADPNVVSILRDGREQPLLGIIIEDNQVIWIGSPMAARPVLAAIKAGTFDKNAMFAAIEDSAAMEEYLLEGNYTDALAVADRMLTITPDNDSLIASKFRIIFAGLDKPEEAIAYLKEEIARRPRNFTLRVMEISCYRELGYIDRMNKACDELAAAAGKESAMFLILSAKSILEAQEPDIRNAVVFLNTALQTGNRDEKAEALQLYARACQLAGDIEQAITCQELAIRLLPPAGAANDSAIDTLNYYRSAKEAQKLIISIE